MGRNVRYQAIALGVFAIIACNDGDSTSSGGSTVVINPPPDTNNVVCDPFNDSNPALVGHGIASTLYYLSDDQPRYTDVMDYINNGHQPEVTLYLNDINVPTRYFSNGFFTQGGELLLDQDGNALYEYFALQMEGGITLGPNDTEGDYQFSILSDDGSILNINDQGTGYYPLINNDGTHPTQMGCTTQSVHMTASTVVPFIYDYYQGPRYQIASVLLWRHMPTDPTQVVDPYCGQEGNSLFYDWTQTPSAPQQAYLDLQSRGWQPLVQENYLLPAAMGNNNPCAPQVPVQLTNFQISNVTETSVVVTWNTNENTDSTVFIAPYPSTTYTSSYDSTMTTNHSETITGLTNFTVYSVYVTSADGSGNSSSTTPTTFRTLR
jgi:hypothetical protein